MKSRVFYNSDGSVAVMRLGRAIPEGQSEIAEYDRDTAKIDYLKAVPYEDVEESSLPVRDKNRDKWVWAEKDGKKSVKIDHSLKTKSELLEDKELELDTELNSLNANPIKVIKLQRELENIKRDPRKVHAKAV